jgi:anti-sigma factor RsiW
MSEMSCERVLLAQADFDGELDAAQAAAMEAHRADCPDCQAAYAELAQTRAALRGGGLYHRAPESLRLVLAAKLAPLPQPAPSRRPRAAWWRWPAVNLGLGAAVAAALALLLLAPGQSGLIDQLVDDHLRSLQQGHLEDVVSTDQHTVKPWFDGKIDFAPPVKDLADQGFPLTGGRLDYLGGKPVAALVYVHGKHPINLFVWPQSGVADKSVTAERNGYNLIHWDGDGMNFWAVSDLEKAELEDFVRRWRAAS